eukprot:31516-Pelagococcus_subviridis.AAC.6
MHRQLLGGDVEVQSPRPGRLVKRRPRREVALPPPERGARPGHPHPLPRQHSQRLDLHAHAHARRGRLDRERFHAHAHVVHGYPPLRRRYGSGSRSSSERRFPGRPTRTHLAVAIAQRRQHDVAERRPIEQVLRVRRPLPLVDDLDAVERVARRRRSEGRSIRANVGVELKGVRSGNAPEVRLAAISLPRGRRAHAPAALVVVAIGHRAAAAGVPPRARVVKVRGSHARVPSHDVHVRVHDGVSVLERSDEIARHGRGGIADGSGRGVGDARGRRRGRTRPGSEGTRSATRTNHARRETVGRIDRSDRLDDAHLAVHPQPLADVPSPEPSRAAAHDEVLTPFGPELHPEPDVDLRRRVHRVDRAPPTLRGAFGWLFTLARALSSPILPAELPRSSRSRAPLPSRAMTRLAPRAPPSRSRPRRDARHRARAWV